MKTMGNLTKKGLIKSARVRAKRFLEQRFDWIALLAITLLVLSTLLYF